MNETQSCNLKKICIKFISFKLSILKTNQYPQDIKKAKNLDPGLLQVLK